MESEQALTPEQRRAFFASMMPPPRRYPWHIQVIGWAALPFVAIVGGGVFAFCFSIALGILLAALALILGLAGFDEAGKWLSVFWHFMILGSFIGGTVGASGVWAPRCPRLVATSFAVLVSAGSFVWASSAGNVRHGLVVAGAITACAMVGAVIAFFTERPPRH